MNIPANILNIAKRLQTQDNRATDAPIFLVEEKIRVYGFDPAYANDAEIVWFDGPNEEWRAVRAFLMGLKPTEDKRQ